MVESEPLSNPAELGPPVTITGESTFDLTPDTVGDFEKRTESVTVVCASGDRHTADWTGVPVLELIDAADVPAATTHVVVESEDEYRVAIPVAEAIEGLLAFAKDGNPLGSDQPYANRLVSPATEGARDIKGVTSIEPVTLDPADDPETLENLFPEGDRFTANRFEAESSGDQTQ